jgi:hypothetical protein
MAGKNSRIMYVECKSTGGHSGGARICRVTFSKTGRTIYYRGLVLKRTTWTLFHGNHVVENTGNAYWVSGPRRNGQDRHWAGGGMVRIDPEVADEYWVSIRRQTHPKHRLLTQ